MIRNREELHTSPARDVALTCIEAGIAAADPERAVRDRIARTGNRLAIDGDTLDLSAFDEVLIVGAGKGVVRLARGLEEVLGPQLSGGIVVSDEPGSLARVEVLVGDHPLPGESNVAAGDRIRSVVELADERTLVLAVFTGGGSALFSLPSGEIALADLRATTESLLAAGQDIETVNAIRKHLSAVKGGHLARAAAPATVRCLLVSDVVGDPPDVIASGPFAPDPTTFDEALAACSGIAVPDAVRRHLAAGSDGAHRETPTPGDPVFENVQTHVLVNGRRAVTAATEAAVDSGYNAHVLEPAATGEARVIATDHLEAARQVLAGEAPVTPPAILVTGGELTVTVRGTGTGGPNLEFCLAAAPACPAGVTIAAVDTDGRDGNTDAAGAIVDEDTVGSPERAAAALENNDAYTYLDRCEALIRTGPTGTNVNDLRVVVIW